MPTSSRCASTSTTSINSRLTLGINENLIRTAADRGLFGNDNSATSLGEVVNNVPNFIDLRAVCPDGSRQIEVRRRRVSR